MSDAEMNKTMEFIVEQQAQSQMRTVETVNSLTEDFKRLTQAQARTEEAQARTEEHLTILLTVVEGHISGNGGSHSHP